MGDEAAAAAALLTADLLQQGASIAPADRVSSVAWADKQIDYRACPAGWPTAQFPWTSDMIFRCQMRTGRRCKT
jgi:hypothetical protein